MNAPLLDTMEFAFNVFYLVAIFAIAGVMLVRLPALTAAEQPMARRLAWAFTLLGTGDLGHIGLRILGHLFPERFGPWVAWGGLTTAITVTLFYVLMLDAWRVRLGRRFGALEAMLLVVSLVRLALLIPPGNEWGSPIPPFDWSLARNVPLLLVGVTVTALFLRDGRRPGQRPLFVIGVLMVVSFACYLPVILLVQRFPMVGLLMIPKTVAYLAMGVVAYFGFFRVDHADVGPRAQVA